MLATVKGDVHDIGKNLVDIILSNNGYEVVNLGIKQPISEIIRAADEHNADAIGMSGLLVKSTVVMKENLEELNSRELAARWPVLLGGAALTRAYVENDLAEVYQGAGPLRPGRLRGAAPHGRRRPGQGRARTSASPTRCPRCASAGSGPRSPRTTTTPHCPDTTRSDVATDNTIPTPPFWGTRVVKGIALADYAAYLDERATFLGQWGLKRARGKDGPSYEELVETEGRPRLRMWLDRIKTEDLLEAAVVYGYFPCYSEGNDLVVLARARARRRGRGHRAAALHLPAAAPRPAPVPGRLLPEPDRYEQDGRPDVIAFHLVTMGAKVAEATAELFAANAYRDYLELHGLSVQLTEALAETVARPGPRGARLRRAGRAPSRWTPSCARATAGRATPSATRPARTSRTAP